MVELYFGDSKLEATSSLADSGLSEKASVEAIITRKLKSVVVKSRGKELITLDVEASDTIDDVKAKIEIQMGIPRTNQKVVWEKKELLNENILEAIGVAQGSVMYVTKVKAT